MEIFEIPPFQGTDLDVTLRADLADKGLGDDDVLDHGGGYHDLVLMVVLLLVPVKIRIELAADELFYMHEFRADIFSKGVLGLPGRQSQAAANCSAATSIKRSTGRRATSTIGFMAATTPGGLPAPNLGSSSRRRLVPFIRRLLDLGRSSAPSGCCLRTARPEGAVVEAEKALATSNACRAHRFVIRGTF